MYRHYRYLAIAILSTFCAAWLQAQSPELVVPTRLGNPNNIISVQGNKYFLVMGEKNTQIWESSSGRLLKTLKLTTFRGVESQDGRTLFLVGNHVVYNINTTNFTLTDSMYVLGMQYVGLSPEASKIYAYTSNTKGMVLSINLARKKVDTLFVIPTGSISYLRTFGVTSDGRYTLVQVEKSPTYFIENATKTVIKTFDDHNNLYALTPDNKILEIAVANGNGRLSILNPMTFSPEATVAGETKVSPYNINKVVWLDQRRVLLYNTEQRTIADFNTRKLGPDFKYFSTYHSIDHTCAARTENGLVRTVFISISHPESRIEEWNLQTNQKLREVGDAVVSPFHNAVAPDGFRFQYGKGHEVVLGRTINFLKVNAQNEIAAYTPDGRYHLHTGMMGILEKFKSQETEQQSQSNLSIKNSGMSLAIGKNGKVGAIINTNGMYLFDVQNMTLLREVTIQPEGYTVVEPNMACFFDNDRKIIANGIMPGNVTQAYCVEVASGKILWVVNGDLVSFKETPEGILCFDKKEKNLKVLNPQNGQIVKTHYLWNVPLGVNDVLRAAISPDASQVIFSSSSKIAFWNMKAQKVTLPKYNPLTGYVHTLAYFKHDPRFALSISSDGRIVLWNTQEATALATLFLFPKTKDWVCLTPDGRFDASPAAMRKLYYVSGLDVIPLEQLYEKYYTPGLLVQLLGGELPPPVRPDDDIKNLKRPPVVKIRYDDKQRNLVVDDDTDVPSVNVAQSPITLIVEATAPDDVVEEIRLFQNGKLIAGNTRNLVVDDDRPQQDTRSFPVELVPGDNLFRAIALNSQRTESRPAELLVKYTPATPTPSTTSSDITLHALVIGINKYKNPKYNLNYAAADAQGFRDKIQQVGQGIFKKIEIAYVADEQAVQANIVAELEKVKKAAQPKDVFILYYAGHGVLDSKRDFYLVPHDVTQLYGNDETLASKGLSANQLQQFSKDIKAQKQLFILDACQSAGAIEVAMRGAAEEKAIAQLARSTGTHWLTASGSEQFASEFAQLGHGTFTYALLEALGGKADSGDKKITVKEIDAYLQQIVPELTAKYKGTPQYPASYGFGNDFPVGVVR